MDGSVRHATTSAVACQFLVLPPLLARAIRARNCGLAVWLKTPPLLDSIFAAERLWHFAFVGFFVKDFLVEMKPIHILHHILTISAGIASFAGALPAGGSNAFALGSTLLELGSGVRNLWFLLGDAASWRLKLALHALFAASNASALALLAHFSCTNAETPLAVRAVFAIVGAVLIYLRQEDGVLRWRADFAATSSNAKGAS